MCEGDDQAAGCHLTSPHREDPHGSHDRTVSGRHHDPPVHDRDARGGAAGPARPRRGDALSREGAGRRSVAGRAAGDDAGARALLGDRVRLAQVRGETEGATALHHRDRRTGHPLRPHPLQARGRAAAPRGARMARLGHRAAEDTRPIDQSDGARRERSGRVPSRDPVDAGLRILRQAGHHRLGPRAHRTCLGGADEAHGIRPLRRLRRRLGRANRRSDGGTGASGVDRPPHQLPWCRSPRRGGGGHVRRPGAVRSRRRGNTPLREAEGLLCHRRGLRTRAGHPPADAVRNRGFARRPGRLDARPRLDQSGAHLSRLRRRGRGRPDPRRRPRQHHPLLADEHGDLLGTSLLGEQARLLRPEGREHPGSRERLPWRALPGAAELGRGRLSQADPLQQARQGRALRRLGTAGALRGRGPNRPPIASLNMTLFERVHLPSFAGATEWLNSEPLGAAELRDHVVLVNFWTWTCINWLRQEPYIRAWSQAYHHDGLIVLGVHTPEFAFEHEIEGVRRATKARAIDYPVAVDNDYEIWNAFANRYWPALYFADADGVIRDQHFGEGRYEESEHVLQQLVRVERDLVSVEGVGVEAQADWDNLGTPETYLGSARSQSFDHWALTGEWTTGRENVVLEQAPGSIAYRFHARDAHLVLSPGPREAIP